MASLPAFWQRWRTTTFALAVFVILLAAVSEAGKSKTFLRNSYSPQDHPFDRNPMFRASSSYNSRKGGSRTLSRSTDRSFNRFGGGPEAFLEAATTERIEPEEDVMGFKFSGSAGFGASRPSGGGRKGGPSKGGSKGGNPFATFDREAAPGFPPIRNIGGGPGFSGASGPGFSGASGPGFSAASGPGFSAASGPGFSGSSSSATFGGSLGAPFTGTASGTFNGPAAPAYSSPPGTFSGSLPQGGVKFGASFNPGFSGSTSFFGGSPGAAQPGRPGFGGNAGGSFPAPKTPFSAAFPGVSGNINFDPNGGNIQFPPPSGQFPPSSIFPSITEEENAPFVFPQGPGEGGAGLNLPFTIDDELAALLFGMQEATTSKPPIRVTSAEDENKVFSGRHDETDEEVEPPILIRKPEVKQGCNSKPAAPANGRTDCSTYAGCRSICNPGYQFPSGERRLYLMCDNGEWKVTGSVWDTLPDCEPKCSPPCENNGICLAPDVCQCPDNWEGDQCQIPKAAPAKKCSNKPPTPMNSRIFCGKDECSARCHEGYHFAEGTTRLSFQCENGDWVIQDPRWTETPDCEPACDPACENGGRCIAPDLCECTVDFRGELCQYPISNCDPKKLGFNGGYNCSGEGMDFGCAFWCSPGVEFEFPAEDFYKCDYATGLWSPSPIPNCDYGFLVVTPGAQDISTGTYPPGFVFTTTEQIKKSPGVCFTWSGSHYKSFDGRVYSFESSCPFTLLQDSTHGTFSVNLKSKGDCTGPSCSKAIQLFLDDDEYVLQNTESGQPSLEYHETNLAIPGQMNGVVSERVAHYVVVKVAGIGLTLKWDMKNTVITEVNELLWNRTSGLCGRRDGNRENDWGYSDGRTEDSLSNFLQAWQSKTIGDRCLGQPMIKNPCGRRPVASEATDFCSKLRADPKFEPCRQVVDVEPYVTACKWDYCGCESDQREGCACESFSAFFRECTNQGVDLPEGWRTPDLCPMECERGMEYNPCMSAIQPRCGQPSDDLRPEFCVEGCDCPSGLLLHNGKCIRAEDCPCTFHDKDYQPGETIPNDCNSCTCLGGVWVCTEVKCGSRCAVVGDPHYTTFDGRRYDFMGMCSYTLVEGTDFTIEAENTPCAGAISEEQSEEPRGSRIAKTSMNFPASVVSQFPSCTKSVTVRLQGTVIRLKQKREVTVNGVEVKDLPMWINGAYIKKASSLFIMVELDTGIDVWWDGQTGVYVDAPADFRGEVAGLCGTFTDNQRDDFLTPEGDVENNPIAFANKWKISEKCPDQPLAEESRPCDRHVQNKAVAEKYCAKIKSGLFAKCHLEVDPEPYHRDCLYDMCSCETKLDGCLCSTLASYAKECARKGILIDWRAEIRECGVHCTGGQKYQVCGNSCSHTCLDLATNPDCKRKCVEGCNCLDGFSLDQDGICVPITECPCVYESKEYKPGYEMLQRQPDGTDMVCECFNAGWNCWEPRDNDTATKPPQVQCAEHLHEVYTDCMPEENTCQTMHLRSIPGDLCRAGCVCGPGFVRDTDTGACIKHSSCPCHHGGRSYSEGEIIVEDCNTCECEGGQWVCTDQQCPGICSAWGESHYKTFDGRMYEFHGTCDYLLAKGKSQRSDSFEVTVQNVPCGTNGVTCAKSVTLRVGAGDAQEIVEFSRNKPTPTKNLTRTIIREAGVFVFAEVADIGLVLQWDRGTRAYLRLDPSWKGKVRGLCGNYNDDEQDDFKTPSGGSSEVSVRIFGDSWRLQNYCPDSVLIKDTCSLHPHRKVWASEQCAVLKSESFTPCHSEVPVEPYLERCQFDACGCDTGGDCHCLCTAVAAYAHECNIHGVYIAWRTPDFCPMQCDVDCEHYEPCIPTCPHETCDTLMDPTSPLCVQDACVEGCAKDVCPPGYVYKSASDVECVPKADCEKKCLEIDGEVYMEGDVISEDDCHTCVCTRKSKVCRGTPCAPTTTPMVSPRVTTPSPPPAVTTPFPPGVTPEEGECRDGWSEWMSEDKPIVFRKNSDAETIPAKIKQGKPGQGFCERSQVTDIRCRSVGTHRPHTEQRGVRCSVDEGLLCRGRDDAQADEACWNYEIAVLCDCSITTTEAPPVTTPASPFTPPIISTPVVPPVTAPTPMTCEEEGWSSWYNIHFPDASGEFESVDEIRKINGICPDHYVSEVECQPVGGGDVEAVVTCDKKGARCRNSGGKRYCKDYEIRVRCECECQDGLGLQDWRIPNDRITASSVLDPDGNPQSARLFADWAWTAQDVNPNDQEAIQKEWLQVDLGEVKEVTGVVTQGHPLFNFFVERFAVQYSETGLRWDSVKSPDTSYAMQFTGNTDQDTPVTNLFPEPVYARYIRVVPLQFYQAISLRLELKGCDVKETTTVPTWPPVPETTPVPACTDGWTEWMNTHTPSPGDWDDLDDLTSLSAKYSFCQAQFIVDTQCRVVGLNQPYELAGQKGVICNINNGLQCNDDLQAPEHCYDYEVRFYCDCGVAIATTTTTEGFPPPFPPVTTPPPAATPPPRRECNMWDEQITPHETDCRKFYECARTRTGGTEYVEKECGSGTFFHPKLKVCDFEANVALVKPECTPIPPKIVEPTSTTQEPTKPEPCTEDFWTEWFNVSHPDTDNGDMETFEKIREEGFGICEDMYIMDIECQYNKVTTGSSKGGYKDGRKGGRKGGRRGSQEYVVTPSDYTTSRDVRVTCSREFGLTCFNAHQRFRSKCEDYAVRVLCSCEATRPTPPAKEITTAYTDVRESTVVTTPATSVYQCPAGTRYDPNGIRCDRVCLNYLYVLKQAGECQGAGDFAPACVNITSPVACPGNQYLRDKSTCVDIRDCNCRLPNGMAVAPGRAFRVNDCEVCQCSNNYLMCDSSLCLTALPWIKITDEPTFKCNEWTSWLSSSNASDGNDIELLADLRVLYPKLCYFAQQIECRVKGTNASALTAGQNIECNPYKGLVCKKDQNPRGCLDYEVRFICDCSEYTDLHAGELTETTTIPTTTYTSSHFTNVTTTLIPYMDQCVDDKKYVKCALPCDRVCMYYKQILRQNGFCELDGDCAPGCLEKEQAMMCPPGFYMLDTNKCVAVADCSCRLSNGMALPAGQWYNVSPCERCMCQNNNLLCDRNPSCVEITTVEPTISTVKVVTIEATPKPEISFQCNNWSPYFKKHKTSEGVIITLDMVKENIEFPCEVPLNASCREASSKLHAASLGQAVTCDPIDGLRCINLENDKDCYDYEISFFCECEEVSTISPPETTFGPVVTQAPCDAWSPWVNQFRPWQGDLETEYMSLQQLQDVYGFCLEGQLADIECVEAATGQSVAADRGTSCDVRYGFSCKNADQDRGRCLDYKIRYYCTCETTTVITTTFVPLFPTPPTVCDPDKYIHLLKDVDDSAFSSTRARNSFFGPANARLYNDDGSLNTKSWSPYINDQNQYVQIDLGSVQPLYGLEMGGNPTTRERVTAFRVQVSDDGSTWSYVTSDPDDPRSEPKDFRGPVSPSAPQKQMFDKPIEARYVRVNPTVWVRSISMRVEVIGCELPTPVTFYTTPRTPECEEPMGVENGEMSLLQITVSSVLNDDEVYYGKKNIRLDSKPEFYTAAGAWVAQPKPEQFVRFDFLEPSKISGIITQGRSDADEWVESFTVRYSQDGKSWSTLQEPDGTEKIFPGNFDRSTPLETKFDQLIQARYLEVRPETWNSNIAMRLDVLGCFHPYPEITTTPQPEVTTTLPPPPACTPCPGLPEEFYDRCASCSSGRFFDGKACVPKAVCPCYKDGNSYDMGSVFVTSDCKECDCLFGGVSTCKEKTCSPCNDNEQGVLTSSCNCICKPCPEGMRLCPSINYCLNETSWCNGVVECPEDELECPSTTPVIPSPCPTPYCPDHWELTVRPSGGLCPIVKCEPPAKTTPMPCPIPFCPPLYDISLVPKKGDEMCPKYECIPPSTTMAPPECPPLLCPDGYEVQTSEDIIPETPFGECPEYQCVTPVPPTAPCPPPTCPQGYDIFFADPKALLELCPPYECMPIVTTTMCPPVECGEGLRTMYIHTAEGSACPQYTCVQVTTPVAITTEPPVTCPPMELPICKADEELYQINPNELCPRFGCKPFGMTPTPLPEAPRNITPTCNVDGRTFDSFDDSHYQIEPCNHILAEDKINKNWVISMHRNCSFSDSCDRYLKIMQNDQQLILKPDLLIVWDENSYTVSQAQRIGSSQNTFTVSRVGDSIRFSSTVYKFNVEWNTEMNVRIELDAELQNRVDGLCGFYTGYDHDDKTKPDGKLAATMKDYGQSWALDDQPCEEKPKCSVTQSAESFRLCEAIRNDPFTKCHSSVDPSVFMKGCVASTCDCLREGKGEEECRCQALTHYVTRCLETDSTIKLDDWRIVAKCYKECGPGERYQDCFRATCEKSCENLHDDTACLEREGSCVPGCFCSPGLVRKGERCVNPEKCGDCVCEGYGDPHYQTFDRQNYTFNGECSYVAARDKNVRGQHAFQVITRNKQCTVQPVTVCTDAVTVLYKDHTVFIEALGEDSVSVTVDGENIPTFPYRDSWLALEQPDPMQVMAAISEIQLEVNFFLENYGFSVKVPSRLYFNKTEGLCGNCNFKDDDDFVAQGTGLVESSDVFGRSWLLEGEPSTCGVLEKDTTSCIPLPPDEDPCLRIMDENLFGKCHPVEDPVPYVSSCIMDACGSREPEVAACHSLEAYARRCAELDICLKWRSDNLCPKTCPDTLEFRPCGPGCVRTCENFEELNANPDACPISPVDGCFCPDGMVLDNGACINETFCTTCDNEGHRIGDSWKTDPCTTCECTMRGSVCSTKACPDDPICDEGYEVVEVPGTGDDCCGPRKKCRVVPTEDCPPVVKPKEECGYGQRHKLIEAPGVCPQYACVCVESKDCPDIELPKDSDLKPGEEWILDDSGCCPRYKTECTDLCPEIECPEFYEPVEKPLLSGQCCPEVECEPPTDACIYENIYIVDATGFQKSVALPTATKKGGRPQLPEPEKKLYKVGESWEDGLCLKCQCTLDSTSKPRHTCTEQTCPTIDTHPDRGQFQLDSLLVPGQCCPDIVRTACIDDYEVIAIGDRLDDPFNGCRSVECVRNPEGKVDKVEQIHTCDENCPLGWEYEPSPLYPQVCCGECVQVACVVDGEVKNVGETWVSDDFCTTFTCSKDSGSQIQIQAVEAQCSEPSAKDRENYVYEEKRVPGQCCALYTRTACLMDGVPVQAGESVQDPLDNCLTVTCDLASDGNVTRREKETTCDTECALGQTFIEPIEGSNDCCGKCLVTHCVDDGIAHPIGERWESESDICYEYSCETRDDVLTTVAVKKDCPYFDPECPPNEIYMDEKGCCQLCNVTRPVKSDCKPNPMPLVDTVGIFTLAARSVGTCKNPDPVPGFNTCSGHCDSFTTFVAGRRAGHIPTCYCCKPARFEKIRVDMRCDTGYAFARVYDNIVECECLRCDDNTPDYMGDEPILDDAEFFAITAEPTDV